MHVWMFVVGSLEKAAANCQTVGDNANQVTDWEKAVAMYTGSEAWENSNDGFFMYSIAQGECSEFGTCKKNEIAPVNMRILDNFRDGKSHLMDGKCSFVNDIVIKIKVQMTVPIIQGVIRAIYALDLHDDDQEATQGMAAAFAAAILPLVHECGEGNAAIIHNDLAPGRAAKGSYEVVKAALERSFECLGVNCEDIGGLVDFRGSGYFSDAKACNNIVPVSSVPSVLSSPGASPNVVHIALVSGLLVFLFGLGISCMTCAKKRKKITEESSTTLSEPRPAIKDIV